MGEKSLSTYKGNKASSRVRDYAEFAASHSSIKQPRMAGVNSTKPAGNISQGDEETATPC